MNVTLYAPPEPDRPTGGFLYNRRLAEALADEEGFRYLHRTDGALRIHEEHGPGTVVLDSLFLGDEAVEQEFRAAGFQVGWIVHALASQISGGPDAAPSEAERGSLSRAAFAVVPSEYMRRYLGTWFFNVPTLVARPGTEGEEPPSETDSRGRVRTVFADVGKGSRGPVVLCAGPLSEVKNQAFLLEVLARTAHARLLLVGSDDVDPAYTALMQRRARELGVDDRLVHLPPVDPFELAVLMNGCDIYAQPSRFESYGMAVAEAARVGVPVIVPKLGGLPEAAYDAPGVVCEGWEIDEWVSAVDSCAGLPRGDAVPARSWEKPARAVYEFLEAVCTSKR